jgi:hypothetical protein
MIPAIGVMVGAYIVTRMLEIIADRGRGEWLSWIAAGTAILVATLMIDMIDTAVPAEPVATIREADAPYIDAQTHELVYPDGRREPYGSLP